MRDEVRTKLQTEDSRTPERQPTRRDALAAAARWALLGGLGALGLALGRRAGACPRAGVCRGCPEYAACVRPEKEARP